MSSFYSQNLIEIKEVEEEEEKKVYKVKPKVALDVSRVSIINASLDVHDIDQ